MSHIRVLDLSRILAGPWCTQTFADLGAEVIKVERPGPGDDTRSWGPPWLKDGAGRQTSDSSYFSAANRGKRSVTINIARPEGQALVRELARESDVLVENYKVGDLKRYGLDYDSISALNAGIVYCSITGYGQDGPDAHKPGYDFVFQGIGGLMSITGERDDRPGGGPQKVGVAAADLFTGLYASIAILAALNHRAVTGRGQYIDMALLDCVVAVGGNQITGYFATGQVPHRYGNEHASLVPYQAFRSADGHVIVAVGNDGQWQRFCAGIERPDLAAEDRYRRSAGRVASRETLIPELCQVMLARTTAEWVERLEPLGVPCGPINDYAQVFADPQVRHRGLRVDGVRADGGAAPTVASPLRLRGTPAEYRAPPLLGEHTEAILSGVLGKDADEIARLRQAGIV